MLEKTSGWGLAWACLACQPAQSPGPGTGTAPSASVTAVPVATSTSAGGAASAAPIASATPIASAVPAVSAAPAMSAAPIPPPRPSMQACAQTMFIPDCSEAFPEKVTCPAKFADVQVGAYCGLAGRTSAPSACRYAEGTCKCKQVGYCGGVAPTILQQMGMRWVCAAPRAPTDCPEQAAPGKHCSTAGQVCDYGSCGSATQCSCAAGKYQCMTRVMPTPP